MTSTTFTRPFLYPKQHEAFFHGLRYGLTEASTKAGKTVAAISWILERAFGGAQGQNFWWVAPVSDQAKIAFTRIKNGLTRGSFSSRESPTPTITLANGAMIWFKSGDNPDSLYGEDVFAAVVDEASRVKEESWHALRSTLTATQGPCNIIGNVKGRQNWFYQMARLAESGSAPNMHYSKITVLDAIDAGVIPQSELEDAKRTLPENVFRELYMAEPAEDGGNPFGLQHIAACVGRLSEAPPVAFGLDLAKRQDFLVLLGLDSSGNTCLFQRWNNIPWRESIRRIHQLVGEDVPCLVDSTGIGDPVLEELQVGHGNFIGFNFSSVSKQRLMEGLAVSIQSHEISFPEGQIRLELEAFAYELTRTGVRYCVPEDHIVKFDDCVCALALAREQWSTSAPGASLMQFYSDEAGRQRELLRVEEVRELTPEDLGLTRTSRASASERLDNELTELYHQTLVQYEPALTHCARCQSPITGQSRISDGIHSWHSHCVAGGV